MNLLSKYKAMITTPEISPLSPVVDINPITEEREKNSKNAYRKTVDKIDQTLGETFIQPKDDLPHGGITMQGPHPNPESHHPLPQGAPAQTRRQTRPRKIVEAEQPPDNQWALDLEPAVDGLQSGTTSALYGPE